MVDDAESGRRLPSLAPVSAKLMCPLYVVTRPAWWAGPFARSDGTRTSVISELFRTKVDNGLIGNFTFDENGDISESPITILRAERAGGANTILSFEGARIVSVERPRASLVR